MCTMLQTELLKPIWHAFTSLDVDKNGRVSKSQLKVLSYNLCTLLKVPHKLSALEKHFSDDDKGPVSSQGYMPYLKTFILDRIEEDFDFMELNKMCWTMCFHKNMSNNMLISNEDAFKVWCIFNFLSEESYPLVIVTEEIEYFLRKLTEAMGSTWSDRRFREYRQQLGKKGFRLSAWELMELVGMGHFTCGMTHHTVSMAINELFLELVLDVLKQGYMTKKGHMRKNWMERWFVLRLKSISYYVNEDLSEKRGNIHLDRNCTVESLPDKEGKKCLFIVRSPGKSLEISATDKKRKQEWIQAIQTCITVLRQDLSAPHREALERRRSLRRSLQAEEAELEARMQQLQTTNESKQRELDRMRKELEESASISALQEQQRIQTQIELQNRFQTDLETERMVRLQMEEQVAQKAGEVEQYLQRVRELEDMYRHLEGALEEERQARQDEEMLRKLQAKLLEEEMSQRAELEQMHLQQQRAMSESQAERQEMERDRQAQDSALQAAMLQLHLLEEKRQEALEDYQVVTLKLEQAANQTRSWKDKVVECEGLIRLIQPGNKVPQKVTNWGPAAFSEAELDLREKRWQERKKQPAPSQ